MSQLDLTRPMPPAQEQKKSFAELVRSKISTVLVGKKADDFVTSLISLMNQDVALRDCEPMSLIASALQAQSLNLSLNRQLGQAWVVSYRDNKNNRNMATFQLGYKGYIQLAMRTGQYRTINADVVYEGEVRKVNKLTGEIAFDGEKTSDKIIGYFCYFELLNGFSKTLYVTVEDMAAYAKRYSPSVKKETTVAQLIAKANDGIIGKKVGWEGNFNDMALKTVIRRLLSKYGYLSVEMQNAMAHDVEDEAMSNRNDTLDNAAAQTVDLSATEYEEVDTETGEVKETGSEQAAPAPAPEY